MAYVEGRVVHDADSHVMETPDWIEAFAPAQVNDHLLANFSLGDLSAAFREIEGCRELHADPAYRADDAEQLMLRKNYRATGSFLAPDRSRALDLLGFSSQLVFPTVLNTLLEALAHALMELGPEPELHHGQGNLAGVRRRTVR